MALVYKYLSQDEQDDAVVQALIEREREHHNYEFNRRNYLAILVQMKKEGLPEAWPANLEKYKGLVGEALASAVSPADHKLISRLQHRDRIGLLLATTETEQAKVEDVYKSLESQQPDKNRLDAAIARVKAKVK